MDAARAYWEIFLNVYGNQDDILALMENKGHSCDIYTPKSAIKEKIGKKIQFGIKKPKSEEDRVFKVEIRLDKDGTYEKYFEQDWPEMKQRLSEIGGILHSDPTEEKDVVVIALKFVVDEGSRLEEYKRIFQVYRAFKEIILDYLEED